ncbi:unnamed protein product [Fraxinus pennsylvanica]|uniref:Reverse transcriptase Ty1/copia-type domain-containing protein n=1 Tax=Fraxinus pennsylvanica TaxID=56036 RepID=A0AAD1ZKV2_9LAMI|nr:unnamed protein product [Fraxinus pennsylvanica]
MRYFLRMEVARSKRGISVSQWKYVLDLLTETDMLGCKPSSTPMDMGTKTDDGENPVEIDRYQRLVRKLIYLSHTRPNIAFAVNLGICEELWLKKLLEELNVTLKSPIKLYCDNKAAINISLNQFSMIELNMWR